MIKNILFLALIFLNLNALDLKKGWNLIGSINGLSDTSMLFQKVDAVFTYDSSFQQWRVFLKDKTTKYPAIENIKAGEGFWVYSKSEQDVVVDDSTKNEKQKIQNGWQILSPTSTEGISTDTFDKNTTVIIWKYTNNNWSVYSPVKSIQQKIKSLSLSTIKEIRAGEGYWLFAKDISGSSSMQNSYDYIPKGDKLTDAIAYKFLNMTTFGATPELVKELRQKGVVAWVDEQLNMPYNPDKESTLLNALKMDMKYYPSAYNNRTDFKGKEQNLTLSDFYDDKFHLRDDGARINYRNDWAWKHNVTSAVMNGILLDKSQLRQRVAYALSQTIVASESSDHFFKRNWDALAYYYDFLLEGAFGNYGDILYNVSMTPAMAIFLTYYGNQKEHTTKTGSIVTPDENYAREIMQLFSIGLYKLNQDGTTQNEEPVYTQKDVNEMARVFTGLDNPHSYYFGVRILWADSSHSLQCYYTDRGRDSKKIFHDFGEKHILGDVIPAGDESDLTNGCKKDVRMAINLLMNHPNIAPFISKKLIKRLTKSNPYVDYVSRVTKVFNDNGKGEKGDLKAVVKAILLDPEIWDDIVKDKPTKIKETFLAYTGFLRAVNVKPFPYFIFRSSGLKVKNMILMKDKYNSLGQFPLESPSVFNYYSDDYIPSDNEFRLNGFTAPELEIQTTAYMKNFSNLIDDDIYRHEINNYLKKSPSLEKFADEHTLKRHYEMYTVDMSYYENETLKAGGFSKWEEIPGYYDSNTTEVYKKMISKLFDVTSLRILGKKLEDEKKQFFVNALSSKEYVKLKNKDKARITIESKWVRPIMRYIVTSDENMVQ